MNEGDAAPPIRGGRGVIGSARMLADLPDARTFRERFPWLGGDLQTIRNTVIRPVPARFRNTDGRRLTIPLNDGTGDRMTAQLDEPEQPSRDRRPPIILVHGLTGCDRSFYVLETADRLLALGRRVVRLNLRGAGSSRPLCRQHYHSGRSDDLAIAIQAILDHGSDESYQAVGFSLGGNILLRLLGEGHPIARHCSGAAAVSTPIQLADAARAIGRPRNGLYQSYLLHRMKAEAFAGPSDASEELMVAAKRARGLYEFDDRFVAPRNGFADAADYYRRCSAAAVLDRITTPTCVILAENDPWVPVQSYRTRDWSGCLSVVPVIVPGGGHVGFHDRQGSTFHDRALAAFLEMTLM